MRRYIFLRAKENRVIHSISCSKKAQKNWPRTDGRAEKPTDGPTDERKDKQTDGRTDGPTNGQTNRRTKQTMDGSLHSCRVASSGLKAQLYTEGDYRWVYLWAH